MRNQLKRELILVNQKVGRQIDGSLEQRVFTRWTRLRAHRQGRHQRSVEAHVELADPWNQSQRKVISKANRGGLHNLVPWHCEIDRPRCVNSVESDCAPAPCIGQRKNAVKLTRGSRRASVRRLSRRS